LRIFSILTAVLFLTFAVRATETPWIDHGGMLQTRLVSASADMTSEAGVLLAWEAKLAPGWKTYWRSPGEAGLPVRVFVGGDEVAPMYPYPERFELFGIHTFGYSHQVLIPFRMKAAATRPVKIRVDFMVCKDICVPFEQAYEFVPELMGPSASEHDIRFGAWLAKVPLQEKTVNGLEVIGAKVAGKVGHQKLIVDVKADGDLSKADLLAEVNDMFNFSMPKIRLLEDGRRARIILSAMTSGKSYELRGETVRLTLSDGRGGAIDRTLLLPK